MKKLSFILSLLIITLRLSAIEGMWLPILLQQLNEKEMQQMGLRLTAEDIYSVNHSSLKDAILIFGRGCTAEIISSEGLILTNHHCGFGSIQRLSSVENDYLTNGFWAMNRNEELPSPGLTVTLMIKMEDVTQRVLEGVSDNISEFKRKAIINDNIKAIEKHAADSSGYDVQIKPFYYGNEYYMFYTETFRDVRLVGAPPSNIGKFGGDTDNWMWPRHTGDFSLFRVYAGKDNKPADYSPDNVPYKPKYFLPISLKGVEKDDFTFVFGYPGRTQQYLPAIAVDGIVNVTNPVAIKLREHRLDIFNSFTGNDARVRLQYADKHANIANGWKKMIGENRGIKRMNSIDIKRERENEFLEWTNTNPNNKTKYGGLIPAFEEIYQHYIPLNLSRTYLIEAGLGIEAVRFAMQFIRLEKLSLNWKTSEDQLNKSLEELSKSAEVFFKNYNTAIDQKVMTELLQIYYSELDKDYRPSILSDIYREYKGSFEAFSKHVFEKSYFTSQSRLNSLLNNYKPKDHKKMSKDPVYRLANALVTHLNSYINLQTETYENKLDSLQRIYVQGLREMKPNHRFYPDANFTLRVAYGKIDDYIPMNAVHYQYYTTIDGIMEKEDPDIYDYVVEDKLKELYHNRDYGRYADKNGDLRICFIASNHTTGGNSGSPVLNADGQLVGINFDRNWEGTMSDLMYDPKICRNISLDIKYCLFIVDKFAGAGYLLDEMNIIE
ncbi:MAG: S46 family peptidase [Bacteroidales bacterium]